MAAYAMRLRPLLEAVGVEGLDETPYLAPAFLERDDLADRRARLADMVATAIVPRLIVLHREVIAGPDTGDSPAESDIRELARLVLSPDLAAAAAYVTLMRQKGLSMDALFVGLLEPAARYLGTLWENDACDFVDVTLGLGRLQKLLAVFNCTHTLPALDQRRRVLLAAMPDDPHSFGLKMVEKFLTASAWTVEVSTGAPLETLVETVEARWFAVIGLTLGSDRHLEALCAAIPVLRARSCNPAVKIMVGGGLITAHPDLARTLGADGMAADAPTAVLVAQRLFDLGAGMDWPEPPMPLPPAAAAGADRHADR
ncbi:MAG: hypothetical protein RLY86_598 [Pseudomonadota bacterium]|jgi:methanogenic corrinoid protein MtbC1